ncbi:tagaturonate reductase [Paenibacillus humicola]|uniref:tagaturonate reductase n=1 Tax=Paenibacillus humicola TaxID=3110540 RepID=UPI00237A4636|nr:tagaturonate reductase [Paenibacillus humicola]
MGERPLLTGALLEGEERSRYEAMRRSPVTVLQIGEGNFLRGFVDWMLHECRKQGVYDGSVAVTQPRAAGKAKLDAIRRQDGLYTLVVRGLESGEQVNRSERVTVFSEAIDPYEEWQRFLALAELPSLQFVVSNTTEAGLAYSPERYGPGEPVHSFPGKLTALLHKRYEHFGGAADKGLVMLPCELLERNGDELKRCVLRYAADWGLPAGFVRWAEESCRFLNGLVDRIVPGHPGEEAAGELQDGLGYEDPLLITAEPYYIWAIEAEAGMDELLPLRKAGLNVHWVDDLKPFQLRKVRILNGAHSLMTPLGLLNGIESVREAMEHPELGPFITGAVEEEIVPAVPLDREELMSYARQTYDRFRNPYLHHRLADISMNGVSKFKARLLPTLESYAEQRGAVPRRIAQALAGLLRLYKVKRTENGFEGRNLLGGSYAVRDDTAVLGEFEAAWAAADRGASAADMAAALLGNEAIWGTDLTRIGGLADTVAEFLTAMERRQR